MDTFNTTKELIMNTAVPVQTRTYKPVSHSSLIDLTLNSIEKAGFSLDKETLPPTTWVRGSSSSSRNGLAILWEVSVSRLEEGWHSGSLGIGETRRLASFIEGIGLVQPEILVQILIFGTAKSVNYPSNSRSAKSIEA